MPVKLMMKILVCMIEKGEFLPFLFPEKFVKNFTKNLDEAVPKIVKDFTKNLDEFRLTNIFFDFFRNLVYTLGILKKK